MSMSRDTISELYDSPFDRIRQVSSFGTEFWRARALSKFLNYKDWRNFCNAIARAKTSCTQAGYMVEDHFGETTEMVKIGSGAERELSDFFLSRYACYLIAQNGDPANREIALAQAYFAVKTRQQELSDEQRRLALQDERIATRGKVAEGNLSLSRTAQTCGVRRYALFHNRGCEGLYGGRGIQELKTLRSIPKNQDVLDRMGTTELAANLFRITQTNERLKREGTKTESAAIHVHYSVGQGVREVIKKQGNPLPETLPVEPDISPMIEKRKKEAKRIEQSTRSIS